MAELKITQIKSGVDSKDYQRAMLRTLRLKRIGQMVMREDRPEVFGMICTIVHLMEVEEVR